MIPGEQATHDVLPWLQVFLEGELERGIVPEESVWMHGGGAAEDGCLLLLRKMNLELLRRCAPLLASSI